MSIDFKGLARKTATNSLSPLMQGRTKGDINVLVHKTVTLLDFDPVEFNATEELSDGTLSKVKHPGYVITFAGIQEFYFNAPGPIVKFLDAVIMEYDGDVDRARNDYADSPCKVDFRLNGKRVSNAGRQYWDIEVVE